MMCKISPGDSTRMSCFKKRGREGFYFKVSYFFYIVYIRIITRATFNYADKISYSTSSNI